MPGLAISGGFASAYCTSKMRPLVAERSEGLVIAFAVASAGSAAATAAAAAAISSAVFVSASAPVSSPIARASAACAAATAAGLCSETLDSSSMKHSGATTYTRGSGTRRRIPHCSSVARGSNPGARGGLTPSFFAASRAATCFLCASPSGKCASSAPCRSGHFLRTRRSSPSTVSNGWTPILSALDSTVSDLTATKNLSSPALFFPPRFSARPTLFRCTYGAGANRGAGLGWCLTCDKGANEGGPATTPVL
mmetsp:Transcript_10688/g.45530  ORF Transcript_10688/g.45530 Transcript_10688/m.45530 type:complete len:252 (+) Transcript_10688:3277-4032(+)